LINDQLKEFGNTNDISKMTDDICISSLGFNKVLRNF
jgi:hypothetical protein